jgi:hypothetical protein
MAPSVTVSEAVRSILVSLGGRGTVVTVRPTLVSTSSRQVVVAARDASLRIGRR